MFSVTITSKSAGRADEVHRAGVDQHVRQRHVGELLLHHALGHLAPQARRLEHVGLVDGAELLAAAARDARRGPHDALDLGDGVDAGVAGAIAVAQLLAEVDAAGQLAHHQQVDAGEQLGPQRRRVQQLGVHR